MVSHNYRRFSLVLLLLLYSVASSVALGRRYIRPTADSVMSVNTPTSATVSPRQQQLQQLQRIYCRGELLHEVQTQKLFPDSKHFVDMPIKITSSADEVLTQFQELFKSKTGEIDRKTELAAFVDQHFDPPGAELAPITPPDYQENTTPQRIAEIQDGKLRLWAMELHKLWKVLARVPVSPSADQESRSSFLHSLPITSASGEPQRALARDFNGENVLIVPGGRFRESYYWDSYWIVQGLLVSGLRQTARGVVNHLLEYVDEFGFVPNGGRIYYLTRSQPPMLSDMVRLVAKLKDGNITDQDMDAWDLEYLRAAVPLLEREYSFWMHRGAHGHAVEIPSQSAGETFVLNRYVAHADEPRPESYREDVNTAASTNTTDKASVYNEIIAAAESGWDFSSRWFGDYSTLATIRTSRVIPVELNTILHRVEVNLAKFHELLGNPAASERFRNAANTRARAMDAVFWSEADGCWKDYLLDSREHSPVVSVANYSPLWAGISDSTRLEKVVASLEKSGLVQEGGVQATITVTGQQWDAPNAWPPLQDIIIEGLQVAGTDKSRAFAKRLVQTWVKAGFVAWQKTGLMFEKYNALQLGGVGDGGEYTPQFGFGWSNGVILTFLTKYQDLLGDAAEIVGADDV